MSDFLFGLPWLVCAAFPFVYLGLVLLIALCCGTNTASEERDRRSLENRDLYPRS